MAENLPCTAEQLMYYIQDALRDRFPGWQVVRHSDRVTNAQAHIDTWPDGGVAAVYLVHPESQVMFNIDIVISDVMPEALGRESLAD